MKNNFLLKDFVNKLSDQEFSLLTLTLIKTNTW